MLLRGYVDIAVGELQGVHPSPQKDRSERLILLADRPTTCAVSPLLLDSTCHTGVYETAHLILTGMRTKGFPMIPNLQSHGFLSRIYVVELGGFSTRGNFPKVFGSEHYRFCGHVAVAMPHLGTTVWLALIGIGIADG
jgi:hypothetical protein